MFSIYSQGWAADARKQSSIEVTKIKAFKKNNRVFLFVCFLGGFFLFNFYFHVLQQNNVYKMELMEKQHCVECLAPVSPSAEGTRTHAKTNPGTVSLKAPSRRGHLWAIEMFSDQATVHKTNPIELPHDPREHGRVSEIWQQIYLWSNFFGSPLSEGVRWAYFGQILLSTVRSTRQPRERKN